MTTTAVGPRRSKLSFRTILPVAGGFATVVAGAVFVQAWGDEHSTDSSINPTVWRAPDQEPSVAEQIEQAITAHSAVFPLQPSLGYRFRPMTAEEAVAQHEALIGAWLSGGS